MLLTPPREGETSPDDVRESEGVVLLPLSDVDGRRCREDEEDDDEVSDVAEGSVDDEEACKPFRLRDEEWLLRSPENEADVREDLEEFLDDEDDDDDESDDVLELGLVDERVFDDGLTV